MNSIAQTVTDASKDCPAGWRMGARRAFDGLAVAAFILAGVRIWRPGSSPGWAEAILLVALTLSTLASLARELPLQNVLLAAGIAGLIGGGANLVAALSRAPFGPSALTWAMPFVWIVVIFTARGAGRLILRSRRGSRHYGFWLLGLTAALSLVLDFGLEVFATGANAPAVHSLGWAITSLLILTLATPVLIRKQPGEPSPAWHPAVIWSALNLLFAAAALADGLWWATGFCILAAGAVPMLAIREAGS